MRLWHKDLIPYLPKLQLLSQWRECCCIAKNIADNGTPNHILVNKIMDYNFKMFYDYIFLVINEIKRRGYKINKNSEERCFENFRKMIEEKPWNFYPTNDLYSEWHDKRYLKQCLFNLEEKAMCGGIPKEEWKIIWNKFGKQFDLWYEE